MIDILL